MSSDSSRQIKQMVNFIMQEAHEKVNEIRIKTDHDFNLEKQNLVHAGKLKVQEEYAQKEKDLDIEQRVSRSAAVGNARIKKMKARDELLEALKKETLEELAAFCKSPGYSELVKKLIVQGLIKIEETIVEIHARAEDHAIVKKVLPDAIADFKFLMAEAGRPAAPKVTLSESSLPSKMCRGGVVLSALGGKIMLNQTVDERLNIAYTDMMPAVRHGLFSEST
mmetsp:Transcript_104944/g.205877  ORF Transcript_104944/g.205877 Transcript_104944/m.205877 type:complete len:222 (+) Transcript_104944:77-742(+)|eukprot:CAMPEP_0170408754 /NCGR_PEP_ID=MMETSP0117_2-20130122/28965_1 /TAXON_ID=400756 /ORGANISM="Durinskia baltica, Strain CSIRO CS-38" /LENGTH=221 /DNA_ID=CAMNT_0010666121 /DNA_START=77 /DNA_END=742 /DNA_ORIENTATION=-